MKYLKRERNVKGLGTAKANNLLLRFDSPQNGNQSCYYWHCHFCDLAFRLVYRSCKCRHLIAVRCCSQVVKLLNLMNLATPESHRKPRCNHNEYLKRFSVLACELTCLLFYFGVKLGSSLWDRTGIEEVWE